MECWWSVGAFDIEELHGEPLRRRCPRRPSASPGRHLACWSSCQSSANQDATATLAKHRTAHPMRAMPTVTDAARTMQEDCGAWPRLSDLLVPLRTGWKMCALQGGEGAGQAGLRHGNQWNRVVKWAESSVRMVAGTHWVDRERSDRLRGN
jgi:hypothetical protein